MANDQPAPTQPRQPSRQTLPRWARIRSRREFDHVFQARNRASDAVLTVYVARGETGPARLGIAASRRLGNAVARNRVKRLVREAFRRLRADLPAGSDWVVVPRQGVISLRQIEDSFWRLSDGLMRRIQETGTTPASSG